MNINSETMKTLLDAFHILTDENSSSQQYLRECSRTTGTPHRLHDMFEDLDEKKISEDAFQDKYWLCFQATHLSMLEDASRANARESYRGYWLKMNKELAALCTLKSFDAEFVNLEAKGAI